MNTELLEDILTEWSYRCTAGYPDINSPKDREILLEIYKERNIIPETVNVQYSEPVTESEILHLKNSIESIKEQYAKYLSVFYYFDTNSLGTISEVLLTKLLNAQPGIDATHTGASQGLADLVVDGMHISLKTSEKGAHIPLGSNDLLVKPGEVQSTAKLMQSIFHNDEEIQNRGNITLKLTVNEILDSDDYANDLKTSLKNRIEAIAEKMSGNDNKEKFVWVEKVFNKERVITSLVIHILDYNKEKVIDKLMNSYPYITNKAWGLKSEKGTIYVIADNKAKVINIHPEFIYDSSDREFINVDLEVNLNVDRKIASDRIGLGLFKALEIIYDQILSKNAKK